MIPKYCECGIQLQRCEIDGNVELYCPRCNIGLRKEPLVADTVESSFLTNSEEFDKNTTNKERLYHNQIYTYDCDACGTKMLNACRARCPNCNWEKPC